MRRNDFWLYPSAVALRHAQAGVRDTGTLATIAVIVPGGEGSEPLEYAAAEAGAVAALTAPRQLESPHATIERVLSEIGDYDVIHFACPATARTGDPLSSFLQVDDGELRLEQILGLDEIHARLVVLSACKTAVPALIFPMTSSLSRPASLRQAPMRSYLRCGRFRATAPSHSWWVSIEPCSLVLSQ